MGRRPTVNLNLPPDMCAKKGARGQVWYYLDKGVQPDGTRPWVPFGSGFPDALRAYAEQVETMKVPPLTVPGLLTKCSSETATDRKAGTLDDIRFSLPNLMRFSATCGRKRPATLRRSTRRRS